MIKNIAGVDIDCAKHSLNINANVGQQSTDTLF